MLNKYVTRFLFLAANFVIVIFLVSTTEVAFAQCSTTADFSNSAPACTTDSVEYINTGTTGATIASFAWTFGSGSSPAASAVENPPKVVYSTAGLKSVVLTVTDTCGTIVSKTYGILINETPTTTAASTPDTVCEGQTVDFTNTGSTGGSWTYSWDFGVGATPATSTGENPTDVLYNTAGNSTVTFTITDGTCSATATATVVVEVTPSASFASTAPVCTGDNVDFTNTGSTGGTETFAWNFGSGATPASSVVENPTGVTYSTAGTKSITLIITDGNCADTSTQTIDINQTPTSSFTSTAPVCAGTTVDFTNTGSTGGSVSFFWDFGVDASPATSTAESPAGVVYSSGGSKTVTQTVTDGSCTATSTSSITINNTPSASFASTAPECTGLNVDFTNTGSTGGGVTFSWNFGSGASPATSTSENPTGVTYSTAGTKSVSFTITDGGCANTATQTIDINQTPTSSFTTTAPVCAGATVDFTNTGSTGGSWAFLWDFGVDASPATSTAESPSGVTYSSGGSKTITLTISDGSCTATTTATITINNTPAASFASTAPECTGLDVDFTNTGSTGGGVTFSWNFGSGASPAASTLENPTGVVYSTDGTKSITFTITDGGCANTVVQTIDINLTPTVAFTSTAPVCAGANVNFSNTGSTGGNWSYQWDFGSGANPSNSSSEFPSGISYNDGGTKTITLTIADGLCIQTDSATIIINSIPFADAGEDTIICANRSVQIGTAGIAGSSYNWFPAATLDDGSIAQPTASPTADFTTYIVTVTDSNGCQNIDSILVTMLTSALVNAGIDIEICFGDTVQIGMGLLEGQTYSWSPTAGLSDPTAPNPFANPTTTTLYTLTAFYADCDSITDEVLIIVHPLPDADAGDDVSIPENTTTQLIATGGIMYEWDPPDGLNNISVFNPVAGPDATTTYIVTVTGIHGCVNWDTVTVTVIVPSYYIPNAFTPNVDGRNDIFRVRGVGIDDFELYIFDRWGRQIFVSQDINKGWDGTKQGSGEESPAGAYVYYFKGTKSTGEKVNQEGIINLIR
ncbi:MAG: PKD domain-containing protein [Bacteroidetes bacterium]|nr:PKD domain-containing protein [Bacteroidota bacterium]